MRLLSQHKDSFVARNLSKTKYYLRNGKDSGGKIFKLGVWHLDLQADSSCL